MRSILATQEATSGGVGFGRAGGWSALPLGVLMAVVGAAALHEGVAVGRIVMLLLVAPIAEEALFRAGLHEALLRRVATPWLANLATAFAFAAAHALYRGDASALLVLIPALLIGVLYQRTRRVRHCVLLHGAMNALWLAGGLAGLSVSFAS